MDLQTVKQRSPELLSRATGTSPKDERSYSMIRCPFHNDTSPSLMVKGDGKWWCFVCTIGGDIMDWIGYQQFGLSYSKEGEQLFKVIEMVSEQGITPMSTVERIAKYKESDDVASIRAGLFLSAHSSHENLINCPDRHQALYDWGLCDRVIIDELVGWDGERYTFPAFYRGVCFGIKRRLPPDVKPTDKNPKYNTARHSKWGMYASDKLRGVSHKYVVVTEDEKSALALMSCGVVAVATTGGSGFWQSKKSAWWIHLFASCQEVIFWRDYDEPKEVGLKCALDFFDHLPRAIIIDSRPHKDAGNFIEAGNDPHQLIHSLIS